MISCIICSRTADIQDELRSNIESTVGCDCEIVVIDNHDNRYSIFSAYNEGVRRAKGDIFCFMHDDVLFHTQDWGMKISKQFEDDTIGLVGIEGTHFLPQYPTYWSTSPFISQYHLNNADDPQYNFFLDFFKGNSIVDVVACDGLCFFVRASLFHEGIRFDEDLFGGFHYYDMDICMQVLSCKKRVVVCRDVLIEHNWCGHVAGGNSEFVKARDKFFNKWKDSLPIHRGLPDMPEYVFTRINYLYRDAYDAEKARKSKAYRLGNALLKPFKFLKKLL